MRDTTKSVLGASWAMSLFSVKQLMNLVSSGVSQEKETSEAFDAATQATGKEFNDDMIHSLFAVGDELQREVIDLIASSITVQALNPTHLMDLPILKRSTDTLQSFMPGKNSTVLVKELKNKFTVFNLVKQVPITMDLPDEPPFKPLTDIIGRAMTLEEYPRLWVIEGLGHYHGDTFYTEGVVPRKILSGDEYRGLPAPALTMLHAGIGMAFGQHLMRTINHLSPRSEVQEVLKEYIHLCHDNSQPGYEGCALESLGLISRHGQFYGETSPTKMVQIISEELSKMDIEAYGYFWHGVGRATYFLPINFIPGYGSISHATDMIRDIAPDDLALCNGISGLAWGVTMVNIRDPEIMAHWMSLQGEFLSSNEGLTNGFISGLIMRQDTTPNASFIEEYYNHDPVGEVKSLWQSMVKEPGKLAMDRIYPALVKHKRLGEIFRYQPLDRLVDQLESESQEDGKK